MRTAGRNKPTLSHFITMEGKQAHLEQQLNKDGERNKLFLSYLMKMKLRKMLTLSLLMTMEGRNKLT
jgi:hypothetical protein